MHVGIGYSEEPDTSRAGREVAEAALKQAGKKLPCDLVLLFSTARHDGEILLAAVAAVLGENVPIIGGGTVGAISNDRFGYAGDQIILAALWLEQGSCELFMQPALDTDERAAGVSLGRQLSRAGITPESYMMLFYDAIDKTKGDMRMVMATYLLDGLQEALGFFPKLTGAGLQGDYICTPTKEFLGDKVGSHHALALAFSGDIQIDTIIMHGCRPMSGYYTVTKADRQTILEINGEPALPFIQSLMGPHISPDEYAFFLILGMNNGDKWAEFDDNAYANRLCLAIDKERNGLVMFEPDMVEGTEFQIMQRSLDLEYISPKIEGLFSSLGDRVPVFAIYIDCAGRAAGYSGSGTDMEDAVMVQKAVKGRAPLLGLYTGVEIAPIMGQPRGLDWTGVFNLFSISKQS